MTYYESAEDISITKKRALKELRDHGMKAISELKDFISVCGNKKEYDAQVVLEYLGY